MLGTTETLLMYYLGFGFVIFLGWVVCLPDRQLDTNAARRYLTWTAVAAVIGLLHPAIALAAKDVIGQVGIELPDDKQLANRHARVTTTINVLAVASFLPAAAILVIAFR